MKKRWFPLVFIVPFGLIACLVVYFFVKGEPLFLLKKIRIEGNAQVTEAEIMARIEPLLGDSIFSTDVGKVNAAIASHPYVREVRIKKVYPFSMSIAIREKEASALWVGQGGEVMVLDEEGVPYRRLRRGEATTTFVVNAPDRESASAAYREMTAWLKEGVATPGLLSEVVYQDGMMRLFGLEDGVEIILGREDRKERFKRAMTVLEDAKKRGLLIKCIDARFDKGAIVKERKG